MAGAAGLCGMAALRGGAGLVTVACPYSVFPIVAGFEPSYLTMPLECDEEGRLAAHVCAGLFGTDWDAIAVGPGLGKSDALAELIRQLLAQASCPVVVDADGLNLLANQLGILAGRSAPTVLTPHPGEFSRLMGKSTAEIQEDREQLAAEFARQHQVTVVLKGNQTIVTDGTNSFVNPTGNPGMATGGTGDVLTGLITALIGQQLSPYEAACLGVYLHGDAGDLAAEETGDVSLIARDLIEYLPAAFRRYFTSRGSDEQG